ncbi:uncharacterized protein si:ch211-234p6.5 isoform X2 [Engraulis encrasicolus]|uniref:uncharacterized protein si:ch211-234p6.5 isoform X2 n=1 Tax=Engraulis encrasicolus TaxID=184585 RepID=UPI002FD2FC7A
MDEPDRLSHASSVVTIYSFPLRAQTGDEKVQTFGKRCYAVKRDPNYPVVIRGWLYKKDSSGLKLWKRRWFVLSEYCLFYYKDSREETVLGSIPLPSYSVLFCTPRECKNRKYTFKVAHQGMRTYVFSADTQEDMLGWVRAISQSATMDTDSTINKRCSSYQDLTKADSTEFMHIHHSTPPRNVQASKHMDIAQPQREAAESSAEKRGNKTVERSASLSNQKHIDERPPLPLLSIPPFHPSFTQSLLCSRGPSDLRPHTPAGRVDIRPHDLPPLPPSNKGSAIQHMSAKALSNPATPHCQSPHSHSYSERYDALQGSETQPSRVLENHVDVVLTKLCGCDKQLQSLCAELSQLQVEKDNLQAALEVSHMQWQEPKCTEAQMTQKALLQEELVTIRARICDVLTDMDCVWCQYERMESELTVFRSQLQHICHYGLHQEQHTVQKQLWMMEDILCGLRSNRNHYRLVLGLQDEPSADIIGHNLVARCESQSHSKSFPSSPEQKLHDWNQDYRVHTWSPTDPAVNMTGLNNISTKDYRGWQEPENARGTNIYGQTSDVPKEVPYSKHLASKEEGSTESHKAAALPLRVTRVITATLPSALTAHRVSVQDPPSELLNPLPEQIPQTLPKRTPSKPLRLSSQYSVPASEAAVPRSVQLARQRSEIIGAKAPEQSRQYCTLKENTLGQELDGDALSRGLDENRREQREAKLKRVERIRQRVIRSASRENHAQSGLLPLTDVTVRKPVMPETEELAFECSSNTLPGDPKETENVFESHGGYAKGHKHKIHNNFLAHVSFPIQDTALITSAASKDKSSPSSTNNRSEWFLSACEWQGSRPVANHGLEARDATGNELEALPHRLHQTLEISSNMKLNRNEIDVLEGMSRCKENSETLLSVASVNQGEKGETGETTSDILNPSELGIAAPAVHCNSDGWKNNIEKPEMISKNQDSILANDPVAPPVSKEKCVACEPQEVNVELSLYEEIPYVLSSSQRQKSPDDTDHELMTECPEGEMAVLNHCANEVEDIAIEKNGLPLSEILVCVPDESQNHIQIKIDQSLDNATLPDEERDHSPSFAWKRVTMDSTCL